MCWPYLKSSDSYCKNPSSNANVMSSATAGPYSPMMDEESAVLGPASHLDGENFGVVDTAVGAPDMA